MPQRVPCYPRIISKEEPFFGSHFWENVQKATQSLIVKNTFDAGKTDLRVPPSQGYEYFNALKVNTGEATV
jgi:hypothetical protein